MFMIIKKHSDRTWYHFKFEEKFFPSEICSDNTKKKFSYQTNKDWIRFIMLQRIIWFMEKFCFKWIFRDLTFDDIGLKWNFSKKKLFILKIFPKVYENILFYLFAESRRKNMQTNGNWGKFQTNNSKMLQ